MRRAAETCSAGASRFRDPKVKETVGALYKRAWDEQVARGVEQVNRPLV